jgi:hypothetical protein
VYCGFERQAFRVRTAEAATEIAAPLADVICHHRLEQLVAPCHAPLLGLLPPVQFSSIFSFLLPAEFQHVFKI